MDGIRPSRKIYTPWRKFLAWTGFVFWFVILPISIVIIYKISATIDVLWR